jgi:hypothetical protein
MSKKLNRNASTGQFIVGRHAALKFNAVEGLHLTDRTRQILSEADIKNSSGDARRAQIRAEFAIKR